MDLVLSGAGLLLCWPLIAGAWIVATISTGQNGLFRQERIGRDGEPFNVLKIRTMRASGGLTVTVAGDERVTRVGTILRRLKIDELPQLVNVLWGEMSLVGPRPDVPGFADRLVGEDRCVLTVRPGITGPAAIVYRHEEVLLAGAQDPEAYSRDVIWPDKVRINREYVENWSLMTDLRCLLGTISSVVNTDGGSA
ncbi:sugar transferase, partial [Nocardioides sp.]|uniref:sugar transferase n=1 Tax=Nocardioides sp. TaxID=35761 RepID=UPI0027352AD3